MLMESKPKEMLGGSRTKGGKKKKRPSFGLLYLLQNINRHGCLDIGNIEKGLQLRRGVFRPNDLGRVSGTLICTLRCICKDCSVVMTIRAFLWRAICAGLYAE